MMADFSRVRANDYAIFYVQTSKGKEGKFYGIYQIASDPFLKPDGYYLREKLWINLTFRVLSKPYEVFAKGASEWEALDDIIRYIGPLSNAVQFDIQKAERQSRKYHAYAL